MAELNLSVKGFVVHCKCGSTSVKWEIPSGYAQAFLELTCRRCGNAEAISQMSTGGGTLVRARDDRSFWDKLKFW